MAFFLRGALRTASLLLASLGLLVVLCSSRARAESEDDERARAHFVAAEAYYQDGRFSDAAREFEEAYQLSGRPEMLINLARAQERAGELSGAIATLELLLGRYPQTSYRAEAESHLLTLREQQPAPVAEPAPVDVAPVAEPGAPVEPEKRKLWPPRWPTLVVGGAALASLLVAVGTGWAAHAKYSDLDDRCPGGACDEPYAHDRDRGQRLSRTSTGFTFAAVALGGVTAALWILDLRSERAGARAQLGVRSSLTSYEANLRLSF
jgi:tetratricopeptide (TPR) repeat protein